MTDRMVKSGNLRELAESSEACILSSGGIVLPWGHRPKEELAAEIVAVLD